MHLKRLLGLLLCTIFVFTGCKAQNDDLAQLQNTVEALQTQLDALNSANTESAQAQETPGVDMNAMNSENEALKASLADMEQTLAQKQSEIDNLNAVVSQNSRSQEAGSYYNEEDLLWWLVVKFDEAWIRYINVGDEDIFNYMVKDSQVYNLAINYKKQHAKLKQEMVVIQNESVTINGDTAVIYIYELLREYGSNGAEEEKEYHWAYTAKRIDNVWYLTEMKRS